MKSTYFAIVCVLFSLLYISLHLAFMQGAIFEKKNSICVGEFELERMQEGTKFFDKIFQMQQREVDKLREEKINSMEKAEKKSAELSTCYNNNFKLKSVSENKFTDDGKQIIE